MSNSSTIEGYNSLIDDELEKEPYTEGWASSIVFSISTFGFLINLYNFVVFIQIRHSHGSFGYLWAARCFGNIWILAAYSIYPSPTILLGDSPYSETIEDVIGLSMNVPYTMIILLQPLIAFHLFVICYFPCRFNDFFKENIVMIQISICFMFGVVLTVLWIIFSCRAYYDLEWLCWEWECVGWLNRLADSYIVPPSFGLTVVLFLLVILRLLRVSSTEDKRRRRKNVKIMLMAILQNSVFELDILMQDKASRLSDNKWWYFVCYTVSWELSHTLDGLLMMLLNGDIRERVFRCFSKPVVVPKVSEPLRSRSNMRMSPRVATAT